MNWKNVAHLIRVERKAGRLVRGQKLTKYRESRVFTYLLYGGALVLGLAIGTLVGLFYGSSLAADLNLAESLNETVQTVFLSLPTMVLIYSLVFTMFQQIQRSGVRLSYQAPYWLPITWEEHTLASILSNLLGFPLVSIVFISSAIVTFSLFVGQIASATSTVFAMCAAAFMASATTEIFRVLQVRFIGAVYKSTGRAAIWVRFVGSLLFFIVFYIIYFYVVSGQGMVVFIQTVVSAQNAAWFVPFVWLGMTLYSFMNGFLLEGLAFLALSLLFIFSLFYLATSLNRRFGLYEPPAITVSRGVYAPKTGILGKFGFSSVEAALIRKDLKAFTRRRELMTIFIMPIVVILIPLMQSFGTAQTATSQVSKFMFASMFLLPASTLAISLGSFLIGEEGQAVWRIYSSPVSAKSLVKSKYFFIVFFSVLVMLITGIIGSVIFRPSIRAVFAAFAETLLLVFALGAVSLSNGIRGADFTEVPRPRMLRPLWSLVNLALCLFTALIVLAPLLFYVFSSIFPISTNPPLDLYQAVIISAIIATVFTIVFYRIALQEAKELLTKAEI
jgi:hypothetical protein